MSENLNKLIPKQLFWLDLEMTGLNPDKDKILEFASIVTDFDFNEIASIDGVIHQPEYVINKSNDWAKDMFTKSGLFERSRNSNTSEKEAEKILINFIDQHIHTPVFLAGNSIHQDRLFIKKKFPELEKKLHYRMFDVTSLKILMQGRYAINFRKAETHSALNDIRESIDEIKYYVNMFNVKNE